MIRPATSSAAIGYFGKIPSRADFVKGGSDPKVLQVLDDWLAIHERPGPDEYRQHVVRHGQIHFLASLVAVDGPQVVPVAAPLLQPLQHPPLQ